jgi:hypothetical protein
MYKAMYKSGLIVILLAILGALPANAQDVTEAYNLSNLTVQGTARSMGFGGALGSIGGDFSSISVNPAGLGVYRSSEMSVSPSFKINSAGSTYLGTSNNDNNVRVGVNSFGIVFTDAPKGKRYERRKWKTVSFAIGMNRVADFNHNYTYNGNNNTSSASLAFESSANRDSNNIGDPSTLAYLGDAAGLLTGSVAGSYYSIVPFKGGINQRTVARERGSINEYAFSLGGNYKEKLMIGVTLGIPSLKYNKVTDYTESVLPGNTAYNQFNFQSFTYNSNLNITGTGVNLKLGAIYKVTDYFRIGAALHTPTLYSINDVYNYGIGSLLDGTAYGVSTANNLSPNSFNYKFVTPMRTVLSASLILKKFGFITADYEYVNYNTMRYIYPDGMDGIYSYSYEASLINDNIKSIYKGASNVRVGAEAKLSKYFMVRAGFGYYGNPYKKTDVSSERMDISVGLGFRTPKYFADFAFVNSHYQFSEQPYNPIDYTYVNSAKPADVPIAKVSQMVNNATFTVGVKF